MCFRKVTTHHSNYAGSTLVGIILCLLVSPVQAKLGERYQLSIGTYLTRLNTNLAINTDTNEGVDLEDDLGFNKKVNAGWIGGRYRVGENHRIQLNYIPISRSASLKNSKDIIIDNTTIKAGASVSSTVKTAVYDFSYIYSLYKTPNLELGFSTGLYILEYNIDIAAEGKIQLEGENQPSTQSNYETHQKLLAPTPLIGFILDYEVNPSWRVHTSLRYFSLKVNRVSGFFTNAVIGTEYYWNKNWGIGASFSFFSMKIDAESIVTKSEIVWEHNGPFLYAVYKY
ncbi:MAG: hypothetical protein ACC707_15050 [Thiohalomonadales bacterium]